MGLRVDRGCSRCSVWGLSVDAVGGGGAGAVVGVPDEARSAVQPGLASATARTSWLAVADPGEGAPLGQSAGLFVTSKLAAGL